MDQYLVDYTVRNITTGDEEDIRVLELETAEFEGFPDAVREELRSIVAPYATRFATGQAIPHAWGDAQERILELLKPYISDPATYERDYTLWEHNVLEGGYEPALYCDWTLETGSPCLNPAVQRFDVDGAHKGACGDHADQYKTWLAAVEADRA